MTSFPIRMHPTMSSTPPIPPGFIDIDDLTTFAVREAGRVWCGLNTAYRNGGWDVSQIDPIDDTDSAFCAAQLPVLFAGFLMDNHLHLAVAKTVVAVEVDALCMLGATHNTDHHDDDDPADLKNRVVDEAAWTTALNFRMANALAVHAALTQRSAPEIDETPKPGGPARRRGP